MPREQLFHVRLDNLEIPLASDIQYKRCSCNGARRSSFKTNRKMHEHAKSALRLLAVGSLPKGFSGQDVDYLLNACALESIARGSANCPNARRFERGCF